MAVQAIIVAVNEDGTGRVVGVDGKGIAEITSGAHRSPLSTSWYLSGSFRPTRRVSG